MGNHKWLLILLIGLAFILRIYNFSFPAFTSDEARIAYRGYTIATLGKDELGRSTPLIFNSLTEYKLPVVSYLTAAGVKIFGKNDLGVRLPFTIIGTLVVLLTFLIAQSFSNQKSVWFFSGLVAAISPPLILISKTPNEIIVSIFLLTLLFYLLTRAKINLIVTFLVTLLIVLTSVNNWIILPLLVCFTVFEVRKNLTESKSTGNVRLNSIISGVSVSLIMVAFYLFLNIPQGQRSLMENHLTLFESPTIENSINRLRGQGIESNWPGLAEKLLFSKAHYLINGFLHWLDNLYKMVFGQLDPSGQLSFSGLGSFMRVLIIPTLIGLALLIKKESKKTLILMGLLLILTFPGFFLYPDFFKLTLLFLPFLAIIIGLGLTKLGKRVASLIIILAFLELAVNLTNLELEAKSTSMFRPNWVRDLSVDVNNTSRPLAISDDITKDEITPFLQWYGTFNAEDGYSPNDYPYKVKVEKLGQLEILGSDTKYLECSGERTYEAIVSGRDLKKTHIEGQVKVLKEYSDNLGQVQASRVAVICLKEE